MRIIVNIKKAYSWLEKFEKLKIYLSENKEMPSIGKKTDNNLELKQLSKWYHNQKNSIKIKLK
jgi:hypothetical protein